MKNTFSYNLGHAVIFWSCIGGDPRSYIYIAIQSSAVIELHSIRVRLVIFSHQELFSILQVYNIIPSYRFLRSNGNKNRAFSRFPVPSSAKLKDYTVYSTVYAVVLRCQALTVCVYKTRKNNDHIQFKFEHNGIVYIVNLNSRWKV